MSSTSVYLGALGTIALTFGLLILFGEPYDHLFKSKVVLSDGGEVYEMWRNPEVELYCKVYLFNITNAEEFMAGNATKLKVEEIGPYVYRERFQHTNITFNDNGTLSAVPRHPLEWNAELSNGNKEDDILYLPHIAHLSIANVVAKENVFTRLSLNNIIRYIDSQPLVKMTAKEFMMGYKSQLLTLGHTFMPGWIYLDKLGLIDRMYDFEGDYETVFTGETNSQLSGLIDTYNGVTDLPHWNGKHCSNLQNASDGTKFKGGVSGNESLSFYRKSLCRTATMVPMERGTKHGFDAQLYTFEENSLDNGKYNENNKCYCRQDRCLPVGLVDVTDCYYGFPIALSYPHFYKGDDILFSNVDGLAPEKEKHETRFWIQPESGLPLQVTSKFQINMALGDLSKMENAQKFSNMYLPMLWFDITMLELPPLMSSKFHLYLNVLPVVERVTMYVLITIGTTLMLYVINKEILTPYIMAINMRRDITLLTSSVYDCEVSEDIDMRGRCNYLTSGQANLSPQLRKFISGIHEVGGMIVSTPKQITTKFNYYNDDDDNVTMPSQSVLTLSNIQFEQTFCKV